ncbi:DUF4097 family beta strand repeat-containing protein [Eubacterium sp. 1001713B170207_170306_E7]|uniref:DUF4097 family beta strand repeat-containing protein n=1 Tax=Eubacterium sp. 1001713B170207_170306_E7 TaxID=2787097 RepID=UPI00189BA003|nr:DUF4097 family beta strand repeat-containing protein [Eubacterium sp. 1001713B170207_170306_E7]
MRSTSKVAKYVAIALGLILAIFIISVIVRTFLGIFGAFGHLGKTTTSGTVTNKEFSQEFTGVTTLDLDFSAGYLEIEKGDVFKVEGYNLPDNFTAEQKNDTLKIKDSIKDPVSFLNALSDAQKPHLTVTIPESITFNEVELDFGASDSTIDTLKTDRLNVDMGVGRVEMKSITADRAKFNNGAGEVILSDMNLNDMDMECGVGKVSFEGSLTGKNKIDGGVGETTLSIKGSATDFDIKGEAGIGEFSVDGTRYTENRFRNSSAPNSLEISGGVGALRVTFE